MNDVDPWWLRSVGYQVYLPSFQDSNGDGWGDIAGVTSRLDYLQALGVNLLWLTPFFPSPMRDHGYDISAYDTVDPRYGDLDDLRRLLVLAHERGIRVIADLVVNHTSIEHDWFVSARKSRDNPYRNYYIWRDPASDGGPPNNWLSHFGGPAWTFDERTCQYYLHLFTPEQPDLNWANGKVAAEVEKILRLWLDFGLDGFRIDTAHYLTKHPDLPDNPPLAADRIPRLAGVAAEWLRQEHRHDIEQPATFAIHRRWRAICDGYRGLLVGEVYILDPGRLATYVQTDGLHSAFWFGLVESGWSPDTVRSMLAGAAAASPHLSWVQGSHDRSRAVTRYGGGELGRRRALVLATLIMGLPGVPFLYYGEELGLPDAQIPADQIQDPLASADGGANGRDKVRTPMPWLAAPTRGFTTAARPWLDYGERSSQDTVAVQATTPGSHLSTTRRLVHTRRHIARRIGKTVAWHDGPDGLISYRAGEVFVAANLSDHAAALDWLPGRWRLVFRTAGHDHDTALPRTLGPLEAVIAIVSE
jgi:alpha-glucosidase